jgi:hypothetical protein
MTLWFLEMFSYITTYVGAVGYFSSANSKLFQVAYRNLHSFLLTKVC